MRLVTIRYREKLAIAATLSDDPDFLGIIDLPGLPDLSMMDVILGGRDILARIEDGIATFQKVALSEVSLAAPIPHPARNLICVGKNYHEHAAEFQKSGFDASAAETIPEAPIFFTKAPTSVIAQGEAVDSSIDVTDSVDYEGELAVVIGKGGRNITRENAYSHVFGYTIVNDVTARELQRKHRQWFLGKSLDTFCPMGPAIVTADEIPDVTKLRLITRVNGEVRQDATIDQLIFDIPSLIETLSAFVTLEPGDIIATGTCAGVGIGFNPPKYLKSGDRVSVTIDPIGTLENPIK